MAKSNPATPPPRAPSTAKPKYSSRAKAPRILDQSVRKAIFRPQYIAVPLFADEAPYRSSRGSYAVFVSKQRRAADGHADAAAWGREAGRAISDRPDSSKKTAARSKAEGVQRRFVAEWQCNIKDVLKQDNPLKRRNSAFMRYPKSRPDVPMTVRRPTPDTDRGTDRR